MPRSGGYRPQSPEVWAAARHDYLTGHSAADVCHHYGLRLGTFRHRAAADGWRRADQPELLDVSDPMGEVGSLGGRDLETYVDADESAMADMCRLRMARAVHLGDVSGARRWHRMALDPEAEIRHMHACMDAERVWGAAHGNSDYSDSSDSVFSGSVFSGSGRHGDLTPP